MHATPVTVLFLEIFILKNNEQDRLNYNYSTLYDSYRGNPSNVGPVRIFLSYVHSLVKPAAQIDLFLARGKPDPHVNKTKHEVNGHVTSVELKRNPLSECGGMTGTMGNHGHFSGGNGGHSRIKKNPSL